MSLPGRSPHFPIGFCCPSTEWGRPEFHWHIPADAIPVIRKCNEGNQLMRTAKRVVTAAVLGLPLLLGVASPALAAEGKARPPKASEILKQLQSQETQNHTVQNNINVSPITQINNGKGEQNAVNWVDQSNENDTEQNEAAIQDES
ncbi:hypothetical protein [Saccharopolyspora kobensis]